MGKRSRKRPAGPVRPETAASPAPRPAAPSARRPGQSRVDRFIERADERPKPPWHPVPLVELSVLAGLVLLVVGVIHHDSSHGRIMMVFGLALASLAGLETALREHFNGYRSHSTLLAGVPAVVAVTALGFAGAHGVALIAAAVVVFGAGFWLLRRAFRSRAGVAFRV
jgi:hypothetical protein